MALPTLPTADWRYVGSGTRRVAVRDRIAREAHAAALALSIRVLGIMLLLAICTALVVIFR